MKQADGEVPLILLLETATRVAGVAVYQGDQVLGHVEIHQDKSHARVIAPLIEQLLTNLQLTPPDISAVAVSQGPGSYTGLRVGVSTAKGLCTALNLPLIAISSLQLIAARAQSIAQELDAWICPMVDARRMEVYTTIYDTDLVARAEISPMVLESLPFADILHQRPVIFLGDGAAKARQLLSTSERAIVWEQGLSSAAFGGALAFQAYQQKQFEDLITFEPFYLKNYHATKPKNPLKGLQS